MSERALWRRASATLSGYVLDRAPPRWVDYVVSNTMTDLNRRIAPFVWTYDLQAQLVRVVDEAPGVKTFVMRPNQHWRQGQAGQHVELALPIEGQMVRRRYSVSASRPGRFSVTVKRLADGQASAWLHQHLRVGATLACSQPQGRFCYQGQTKLLYVCAGSGITPCHAMVTALLQAPPHSRPDIQLMAQFRQADEVIFAPALQRWADSGVKVGTALSGAGQRIDLAYLRQQCPDVHERDIYLCGPEGFMAQMIEHLQALGADPSRVHTERFTSAHAAALKVAQAPAQDVFDVTGAEVHFKNLHARITLRAQDQGKTLLALAREHGLHPEAGCERGMCGTCKLTLHEGRAHGHVLGSAVYLCTAYPASALVVLGP